MEAHPSRPRPRADEVPVAHFEEPATEQGAGQLLLGVCDFVKAHVAGEPTRIWIGRSLRQLLAVAAVHVERAGGGRLVAVVDVASRDIQLVLRALPAGPCDPAEREQTGAVEFWASFPQSRAG